MKKLSIAGLCIFLFSCQNKEVLLPKAGETMVADVQDHSPIYFFFKTEKKDTLMEVNKNNIMSTTNWLFNIDKRLPLRLVIPEIKKLQSKKEVSMHKTETAENYFTYTDTLKKAMAFLPFTKLKYKLEKPDFTVNTITFDENNLVHFKDEVFSKEELVAILNNSIQDKPIKVVFAFRKKMAFGNYLQTILFLQKLKISNKSITINYNLEYIY
ncbi:hypothetical protein [Flavobacterium sp. N1994]|uniref:hypothetical protein n=1 Tax=Flavobacterium sp. N1994 TaxID=2986827 RepID=UPI002221921C|nr:hypothetical protein [Flavobacterium sp. N1994]